MRLQSVQRLNRAVSEDIDCNTTTSEFFYTSEDDHGDDNNSTLREKNNNNSTSLSLSPSYSNSSMKRAMRNLKGTAPVASCSGELSNLRQSSSFGEDLGNLRQSSSLTSDSVTSHEWENLEENNNTQDMSLSPTFKSAVPSNVPVVSPINQVENSPQTQSSPFTPTWFANLRFKNKI